jgi:membrane protease YdiL (CAAX protease family)
MGRVILAVVAGCVLSVLIVAGVDTLAHMVYPPPAGLDPRDPAAMRTLVAQMPAGAFVIIVCGWMLAAGFGAWLATKLSRTSKTWPGYVVGGITFAATAFNLWAIPHPIWVVAAAVIGIPLATWAGTRAGQTVSTAMPAARAA